MTELLEVTNEVLAKQILDELFAIGVSTFCICPSTRNAPLVQALKTVDSADKFFWYEERSAAFFALGRAKSTNRPAAILTTSGTAVGELLPAAMEAYYTNLPLILVTADRPRRFQGSGAPQSAEQVGIFGVYAPLQQDIEAGEVCDIGSWDRSSPLHLNIRFEDPLGKTALPKSHGVNTNQQNLHDFLGASKAPFVVVGALQTKDREAVGQFLLQLQAPVYLEAVSGLREDKRLQKLRIVRTDNLWKAAQAADYSIDAVLRIGAVPTFRLWRDLEDLQGQVAVCSISHLPYSGLSWGGVLHKDLNDYFSSIKAQKYNFTSSESWKNADAQFVQKMEQLFAAEPCAEASLVHELSKLIPEHSKIYLGNSLPIREWDLAANNTEKHFSVYASRGVNGIDGQISTFLGLCDPKQENWAILGDLTALYDLAGPWIIPQLKGMNIKIVVINNSGGQIFARMFKDKEFLHTHDLSFEPIATLWGLHYELWETIPSQWQQSKPCLIEIRPDLISSERFNNQLNQL